MNWTKSDGAKIRLTFSEPLIGDVAGNEKAFTVTVPEYDYVPGGTLGDVAKPVASVSSFPGFGAKVNFSGGVLSGTRENNGTLELAALNG